MLWLAAVGLAAAFRPEPAEPAALARTATEPHQQADDAAIDYTQDTPPPGAGRRGGGPLFDDSDATPNAQAVQAPTSSWSTPVLARAAGATALVLLLIVAMGRGIRHFGSRLPGWLGGRSASGKGAADVAAARVVQRLSLGPRHQLAWVEGPGGATFVVAYGDNGISLLTPGAPPSFRDAMVQAAGDGSDGRSPPFSSHEAAHAPPPR